MFALDPIVEGPLLWTPLFIVLGKVVFIFVIALVSTMFMVWYERKVVSGMQNRIGPNKAGPFGILQTLADGIKLLTKEFSCKSFVFMAHIIRCAWYKSFAFKLKIQIQLV